MYRRLDHLLVLLDDLCSFVRQYPLFSVLIVAAFVVLCALVIIGY